MKANETKEEDFLSSNRTQFVIPVYQRNYDWTTGLATTRYGFLSF